MKRHSDNPRSVRVSKELVGTAAVVKKNPALLSARMTSVGVQTGRRGICRLDGDGYALHTCRVWLDRNFLAVLHEALDISRVRSRGACSIVSPSVTRPGSAGTVTTYPPLWGRLENRGELILRHTGTSSL